MPTPITITGIPEIDQATEQLAARLRSAGLTDDQAVAEAQRYRDVLMQGVLNNHYCLKGCRCGA
jgi:hypothetical protein